MGCAMIFKVVSMLSMFDWFNVPRGLLCSRVEGFWRDFVKSRRRRRRARSVNVTEHQ